MTVDVINKAVPSTPRAIHGRRVGLLVVEDEKNIRLLLAAELTAELKEEGFHIVTAVNGAEAIRRAKDENVHIILLDIKMPGRVDGFAAARAIRAASPEKPIIFVSAYAAERDFRERAHYLGLYDVEWVMKPSTDAQRYTLFETVRRKAHELEVKTRDLEKQRFRRVFSAGREEGIGDRRLLRVLQEWDSQIQVDIAEEVAGEMRPQVVEDLRQRLAEADRVLQEAQGDLHAVQMAYGRFKEAVIGSLWDAYENAQPHHRSIAALIDLTVRNLSALDLEKGHLTAIESVLDALQKETLTEDDVRHCRRVLRHGGIDPQIDFGRRRRELLNIYLDEEGEEADEPDRSDASQGYNEDLP